MTKDLNRCLGCKQTYWSNGYDEAVHQCKMDVQREVRRMKISKMKQAEDMTRNYLNANTPRSITNKGTLK